MLKSLEVKNFAIIDNIKLSFQTGMTVLTGETGAGKSIIVDAISLLLGQRALKEMISSKADEAFITGVFTNISKDLAIVLQEADIDFDDEIVISRQISKDNRNIVKINNQISSLKTLKDLSVHLADIHSQFDTNQLLNQENYLSLIDNYKKKRITPLKENYQNAHKDYQNALKEYKLLLNKKDETLKQLDLYKFQYQELKNLNLDLNEYQEDLEKINILENIDKINTFLEKAKYYLNDEALLDHLYEISSDFSTMKTYSEDFSNIDERLNNLYYELDDINSLIIDKLDNLDYTKSDYDNLIERVNEIERFVKKYNKSIEELLEYQVFLEKEIDQVENFDEILNKLHSILLEKYEILLKEAHNLSLYRKDIAKKISEEIVNTLSELVIKYPQFEVKFNDVTPKDEFDSNIFKQEGLDEIDFLISTNKGEPLKPLAKTASGGEMSRVMLAFKTIFAFSQKIPTIIFDEIDTGISGFIAKQIARKIADLAKITQVISITHIPQVVAQGTNHLAVIKEVIGDTTKIKVKYLSHEERIDEIAKMLSGDKISEAARDIAKELLINP
ncbi:MAG: DNA repair protein RecN [Candidatus Izemoplasmatales bacterium]|jgi:DNA repair protein RecN (Recombination protein N)|nr:DNA repair protein RecN [Candidatus Izemoplasmatales bacterium]